MNGGYSNDPTEFVVEAGFLEDCPAVQLLCVERESVVDSQGCGLWCAQFGILGFEKKRLSDRLLKPDPQ
jgi:hypothetical protein